MLSDWKSSTCFAGESCSQTQAVVRNADISKRFSTSMLNGKKRTVIRCSSISRLKGAESVNMYCEVNRNIGQSGPRTDEK